jgi:hypothetical protein
VKPRRTAFLIALPVLASLLGLGGCYGRYEEETSASELSFEVGSSRPTIEVRLERGSVEVFGSSTRRVDATFRKRARSVRPEIARRLLERIDVSGVREGDRIRFAGRAELPSGSWGRDLRSDLTLRVPLGVDLDILTGDGRVRIESIDGEVNAETRDGGIVVERLSGSLSLRSGDGSIDGGDLDGDVDVSTEDGTIVLEGAFRGLRAVTSDGSIRVNCRDTEAPASNWVLRTSDGSIIIALPASISAELEATTSEGRIVNRLPGGERGEDESRHLKRTLGRGGPLILLSTVDGRIEIRES